MDRTARFGARAAWIAFAATVAYVVVQGLQIARLIGPPWDAIAIYGSSLLIAPAAVLAMAALHESTVAEKRVYTLSALAMTIMYATYVCLNYVVQLGTVIPATMRGDLGDLRVLDQTPHSLFWDVDALGYICLGGATLLAAQAIPRTHEHRWTRRALLANAAVTPLIMVVYFAPTFSTTLLFLGLPWAFTAPLAFLMLARSFGRRNVSTTAAPRSAGAPRSAPTIPALSS